MKKIFLTLISAALVAGLGACSNGGDAKKEVTDKDLEAFEQQAEIASEGTVEKSIDPVKKTTAETDAAIFDNVKQLTIIDFNATWCGPCQKFASTFEEAATTFADKAEFYSVDIDECEALANKFGIESIPTIVLIRPDGKQIKYVGLEDIYPGEKFDAIIKSNIE